MQVVLENTGLAQRLAPEEESMVYRLGVVSFLNARVLVQGLEHDPSLRLTFDAPSRLAGLLDRGEVDAALVPVIDLAEPHRNWRIISDAMIGCDGETLTVRVFSRVAPQRIERLHVDGDSHTSVALARILWREVHGRELEILPYRDGDTRDCEAVLLIGDKVVNHGLIGLDIETDLGSAWKTLTGLPFVFALWAAPKEAVLGDLPARLSAARDAGVRTAELIAEDYGPALGWPVSLARRYLTRRLRFSLGSRERESIARFFELARRNNIVAQAGEVVFA